MGFEHRTFQVVGDGLGVTGQHGSLVDDADAGQVLFYVEAFAVLSFEGGVKAVGGQGTFYIFSQYFCFFHVFYYDRWGSSSCMGRKVALVSSCPGLP